MAAQRRATIANDVDRQISAWLENASSYLDGSSFEFKSFMRSVEKLAEADAYSSSVHRAMVHHLTGDLKTALYWVDNARKWPNDHSSDNVEAIVLSNLGYFSESARAIKASKIAVGTEPILLLCAEFAEVISRVIDGDNVDNGPELLETAKRCSMALQQMKISEKQVQSVLDIAGEVLRSRKLFFAGDKPVVRTIEDGLLYQFRVVTTPEVASAMTNEVIMKMVERDLDADGLAFSFVADH